MTGNPTSPIVLFDGVCNLCNGAVRFIVKRNRHKGFRFAAMQSDAGRKLLERFNLPAGGADCLVLIEEDACYTKSDALIRIAARLTPFRRCWAPAARLVPRAARDFFYGIVARSRYRLFGKRDRCPLPGPAVRQRFLG